MVVTDTAAWGAPAQRWHGGAGHGGTVVAQPRRGTAAWWGGGGDAAAWRTMVWGAEVWQGHGGIAVMQWCTGMVTRWWHGAAGHSGLGTWGHGGMESGGMGHAKTAVTRWRGAQWCRATVVAQADGGQWLGRGGPVPQGMAPAPTVITLASPSAWRHRWPPGPARAAPGAASAPPPAPRRCRRSRPRPRPCARPAAG